MQAEKFQVNMGDKEVTQTLVIREAQGVNELPVLEPLKNEINGTIDAPFKFLEKRWDAADNQIDHNRTHIEVDRDHFSVLLICNETDKRNIQQVCGQIQFSKQYLDFHINDGYQWIPEELGQFCKLFRTYFPDKQQNMKLVSILKGFKAKINTDVQRDVKENGSYTDNYSQIVDSNIPSSFHIRIPIYKGQKQEDLEVETMAHIDGRDVTLQLISAGAVDTIEEARDRLIDEQLNKIAEIAPEIPIIEK